MTERWQRVFTWVVLGMLVIQLFCTGFFRVSGVHPEILLLGYSCSTGLLLGFFDILFAVGLLFGRSRLFASLLLTSFLLWQGYMSVMHSQVVLALICLASAGFSLILVWYSKERVYMHG